MRIGQGILKHSKRVSRNAGYDPELEEFNFSQPASAEKINLFRLLKKLAGQASIALPYELTKVICVGRNLRQKFLIDEFGLLYLKVKDKWLPTDVIPEEDHFYLIENYQETSDYFSNSYIYHLISTRHAYWTDVANQLMVACHKLIRTVSTTNEKLHKRLGCHIQIVDLSSGKIKKKRGRPKAKQ